MTLTPGTGLGPYVILEPLGRGGMGEVYRARDTRLDRIVAIKVLPRHVAEDAERKRRFEREARALAALSHPHICPIFDVGEAAPPGPTDSTAIHYIVMECLGGETLAARLARGPVPIADALRLALEIAEALQAAHRGGITHRDLKPGNIMLTESGAKLLDFGLARVAEPTPDDTEGDLPTTTGPLTSRGAVIGTPQYMAPEQLQGRTADERADLFAFGAVLYEMVAGRRAFDAGSAAGLVATILSSEPAPLSSVAPLAPPALDHLVAACLAKDPDLRWQSAADVALQLRWIAATAGSGPADGSQPATSAGPGPWRWATVVLAALLAGSWLLSAVRTGPASDGGLSGTAQATRHIVSLGADQRFAYQMSVVTPSLALSPDGRRIVHVGVTSTGVTQLYMRSLDEFEAVVLPGTVGAYTPFFSPDGEWVGFFQAGELRKISTAGGQPVTICQVSSQAVGADWLADDRIVFTPGIGSGLMRVSAEGGTPEVVTVPDHARNEVTHGYPQALPNGNDILFSVQTPGGFQAAVLSFRAGDWHTIVEGVSPRYLPTGHLVFSRGATLWAAPFDVDTLALAGEPQPVVEGVRPISIAGADYAVSGSGLLAYVSATRAHPQTQVTWIDRSGGRTRVAFEPATYALPRVSPDGTRIAFAIFSAEGLGSSVWIGNWRTGRRTRLNVEGNIHIYPLWTPDGTHVTFTSARPDGRLYWKRADGGGEAELLVPGTNPQIAGVWSPDGRVLAYVDVDPVTQEDIWTVTPGEEPTPLVRTRARESAPAFSPDGRWIAYTSDDSGRLEVYVARYPELDRRSVISTTGGRDPLWSPQGGELFFLDTRNQLVAVPMADGQPAGSARPLFETSVIPDRFLSRSYDVSPDGQRFVVAEPTDVGRPRLDRVYVVENWFEELMRLVPVR